MYRFCQILNRIREIGLIALTLGLLEKLRNFFLYIRYRFDYWHVGATYYFRPYKSDAVSIVNSIKPNTVVELGCGLGDILSRVDAKQKIGIDLDVKVISAAKSIWSNANFRVGSLEQLPEVLLEEFVGKDTVDILVMINWTHNVAFSDIARSITHAREAIKVRYLLVDIIKEGVNGFQHNHTEENYKTIGCIQYTLDSSDRIRTLLLIKLDESN